MEMELLRDVTLDLRHAKPYDYYSLLIDREDNCGYSLKDTYGIVTSVFGKSAVIIKENDTNDK